MSSAFDNISIYKEVLRTKTKLNIFEKISMYRKVVRTNDMLNKTVEYAVSHDVPEWFAKHAIDSYDNLVDVKEKAVSEIPDFESLSLHEQYGKAIVGIYRGDMACLQPGYLD